MNQIQQTSHDRIIAKLQHFADILNQRKLEKEANSIINLGLQTIKLHTEISVYEEILECYYDEFQEILTR